MCLFRKLAKRKAGEFKLLPSLIEGGCRSKWRRKAKKDRRTDRVETDPE